jgi:hypothetical protein
METTWRETKCGEIVIEHPVTMGPRLMIGLMLGWLPAFFLYHLVTGLIEYILNATLEEWISGIPGFLVILVLFLLPGVAIWYVVFGRSRVVVDLPQGRILKMDDLRFYKRTKIFPIDQVQDVRVERKIGKSATYMIQLHLTGHKPITVSYEDFETDAHEVAKRLKNLLRIRASKTPAQEERTEERVDEMAQRERQVGYLSEPLRAKSRVSPVTIRPTRGGGMEYVFRINAPFKMALGLTLLAVLVSAGSVGLYLWLGEMGPFAVLPGIIGLLLLLATIVIWTFKSRVLIEDGLVTVRKSVLGIPLSRRIPFSEISQVRVRHQELEGVKEKDKDWEIEIDLKEGPSVKLGASIRERTEAVGLAETIQRMIC